ncbi:MAG: SoxR reducing system RseC family protein [Candidatus Omnitrophica bacterium]|nr:SoxR reducing system RseC family protein [Candidatus Omnitrophota bacterium]
MNKKEARVKHSGIVTKIKNDLITVNIINASACSSCKSKTYCSLSDKKNKLIIVKNHAASSSLKVGDSVNVIMDLSIGFKAIFIGYLIPFFILLIALITSFIFTQNEVTSGLISIFVLFPYYFGVYLLRDRLTKNFEFNIETY